MSEMTSSRRQVSNKMLDNRSTHSSRMLTDFSIQALIGEEQQRQQQPKEAKSQPEEQKRPNKGSLINQRQADSKSQEQQQQQRKFRPKNFQCPACKMAFSNNGQLKNHVRIHTGERPFRCNHHECNKTFTRNEELTRHKLIHTGVRPHACTSCGKRFGRKDHLKKHARTHDRKRMRRKVSFVSSAAAGNFNDDVPSLTKPARLSPSGFLGADPSPGLASIGGRDLINSPNMQLVSHISAPPASQLPIGSIPLSHLHHHHAYHNHQPTTISAPSTIAQPTTTATVTTATTIQQLASDYWYNLLGFYSQHHQPHRLLPNGSTIFDNLFKRST